MHRLFYVISEHRLARDDSRRYLLNCIACVCSQLAFLIAILNKRESHLRLYLPYLKMLVQAVGISVLQLDGAFALRGGLRLLHPWNTKSRALGHAAAEAVPESRQHSSRCCCYYLYLFVSSSLFLFFSPLSLTFYASQDESTCGRDFTSR